MQLINDITNPNLLAKASIVIDYDFQVNDIELMKGKKGYYLIFPKNKYNKFVAYPLDEDTRLEILNYMVMNYEEISHREVIDE